MCHKHCCCNFHLTTIYRFNHRFCITKYINMEEDWHAIAYSNRMSGRTVVSIKLRILGHVCLSALWFSSLRIQNIQNTKRNYTVRLACWLAPFLTQLTSDNYRKRECRVWQFSKCLTKQVGCHQPMSARHRQWLLGNRMNRVLQIPHC